MPQNNITVNSGAVLNFSSGQDVALNIITNRGTLTGSDNISVANHLTWLSGTISGTNLFRIAPGATLAMSDASQKSIVGRRFENAGSGFWTNAPYWGIGGGAIFTNSGSFDFQSDANLFSSLPTGPSFGAFHNGGSLVKSSGTGQISFGLPFHNSGVVTIQSGTITLTADGESPGQFNTTTNGVLVFAGGTHSLTVNSLIQGQGETRFNYGTINLAGTIVTPIVMSSSSPTLNLLAPLTINSYLNFTNGYIKGPADLIIKGHLNWAGGFMEPEGSTIIETNATASFLAGNEWVRRNFLNRGLATFEPGANIVLQTGTFRNLGTANFAGLAYISWNGGTSYFINDGVMTKAGPDKLQIGANIFFENHGQFSVNSGALEIQPAGINDGTINVNDPGVLSLFGGLNHLSGGTIQGTGGVNFNGGTFDLLGQFMPSGSLTFRFGTITIHNSIGATSPSLIINGATVQFEAPQVFASLHLQSGTLGGSADLLVTNSFMWTSGSIQPGGRLTIGTNAVAIVPESQNSSRFLLRTIENFGQLAIDNSFYLQNGGNLENRSSGILELRRESLYWNGGSGWINNAGLIKKTTTNQFTFWPQITLNNSGALNVEEGSLLLPVGTNTGSILVSTDTALTFAANMVHAPGSSLSGSGFIHFAGGTHDLLGTFSPQVALRFSGYSTRVGLHAVIVPTGVVTNNGAEITFGVSQTFSDFVFDGGTLTGPGDLEFGQSLLWFGGAFSGSGKLRLDATSSLNATTSNSKYLERSVENRGTATFDDKAAVWVKNATWENKDGSTLNFLNGATYNWNGGASAINNAGTINKAGTNRVEFYSIPLNNSSVLNVAEGVLALHGGTNTAAIQISTNATLELAASTYALRPKTTLSGSGNLHIANSSILRLETDVDFGTLQVFFDSYNPPQGTFAIANSLGGLVSFSRTVTLPYSFLIGGTLATTASNLVITINGDLVLENGSIVDNPGTIRVGSSYTNEGATILKNPPVPPGAPGRIALRIHQHNQTLQAQSLTVDDFAISWKAEPGRNFQLEISYDLVHWTRPLAAIQESAPGQYYARLKAENPCAFFRLVSAGSIALDQ